MNQTRCPHCKSVQNAPRVVSSDAQNKGTIVRCGSCLQNFRADLNIVSTYTSTQEGVEGTHPHPAVDESWAEQLLVEAETESSSLKKPKTALAKAAPNHYDDPLHHDAGNNIKISLGKSELSEFMNHSAPKSVPPKKPEPIKLETPMLNPDLSSPDETWAQDVLRELEQDTLTKRNNTTKSSQTNSLPTDLSLDFLNQDSINPSLNDLDEPLISNNSFSFGDEQALDFLNDEDLQIRTRTSTHQPALSFPAEELTDPVQLSSGKTRIQWVKLILWSALNLFALSVFTVQGTYFYPDLFQDNMHLKPLVQRVCAHWSCHFLATDPNFLRVDMLIVRPDTDSGHILVDTLIHNISSVEHPFPTLRLTMRDLNNNVIGSSLINPEIYLGSAFNQLPAFSPDTPIHISLMVVDPKVPVASTSLALAQ